MALGHCIAIPSDLSTTAGVDGFAKDFCQRETQLDILVNNAGATWSEPLETFSEAGWDRVMYLNLKGLFFLTQRLLPQLRAAAKKTKQGRIINIASVDGLRVPASLQTLPYPASKAAVIHLTRVLAASLVTDSITVNAIAPGPFESKMMSHLLASEDGRRAVESQIPMGRIGSPEDIAGLIVFLASRGAAYITGATIPLDGGYTYLK